MSVEREDVGPDPERRLYRAARWLTHYGVPGAILGFLLLRIAAVVPLSLTPAKTFALLPVILFCCYELTWLFGWFAAALIVIQVIAHEWAHVAEARRLGRSPGLLALIPVVGPFRTTDGAPWPSPGAEAHTALAGPVRGLLVAALLFAGGVLFESSWLRVAAFGGFALNLVHLLPFRPFDGGRMLPLRRIHCVLSDLFVAAIRRLTRFAGLDTPGQPLPLRQAIGPGLFLIILFGFLVVVVAALVLPPLGGAIAVLTWVITTLAIIWLAISLHPAILARDSGRPVPPPSDGPDWQDGKVVRFSMLAWALLVAAHGTGALVSWA